MKITIDDFFLERATPKQRKALMKVLAEILETVSSENQPPVAEGDAPPPACGPGEPCA